MLGFRPIKATIWDMGTSWIPRLNRDQVESKRRLLFSIYIANATIAEYIPLNTPRKAACNLRATLTNYETDDFMQNILPGVHLPGDSTDRDALPPSHQMS
ncbi:hypothetical protein N7G274_003068 [Stereocaulon virgatum]|uniref:Transcription factor domain-containing protein n=1 Tax=Stereocaulon virgatum TaxID=373712 RepID=A0ABR4ALQ4_9LECA